MSSATAIWAARGPRASITRRQLAKTTAPLDVIALHVRRTPFKFGELTPGNSWQAVADPSSASR